MMAFMTVCMPYCLTDGWLDRFFFFSLTVYPMVRVPYCLMAGTTAGSWAHPSPPLVDDFAHVPRVVDCSPNRSFLHLSTAFTTLCRPYCSTNGSLERFFSCSSMAYPMVRLLYCSNAGTYLTVLLLVMYFDLAVFIIHLLRQLLLLILRFDLLLPSLLAILVHLHLLVLFLLLPLLLLLLVVILGLGL